MATNINLGQLVDGLEQQAKAGVDTCNDHRYYREAQYFQNLLMQVDQIRKGMADNEELKNLPVSKPSPPPSEVAPK